MQPVARPPVWVRVVDAVVVALLLVAAFNLLFVGVAFNSGLLFVAGVVLAISLVPILKARRRLFARRGWATR